MPKLNEISGEIKALEAKIESVDNKADIRTAPVFLLAQVFFFPKRKSVGLNRLMLMGFPARKPPLHSVEDRSYPVSFPYL